jgi:ABC-type nickel/cobalt efflux system permease component RcnA
MYSRTTAHGRWITVLLALLGLVAIPAAGVALRVSYLDRGSYSLIAGLASLAILFSLVREFRDPHTEDRNRERPSVRLIDQAKRSKARTQSIFWKPLSGGLSEIVLLEPEEISDNEQLPPAS